MVIYLAIGAAFVAGHLEKHLCPLAAFRNRDVNSTFIIDAFRSAVAFSAALPVTDPLCAIAPSFYELPVIVVVRCRHDSTKIHRMELDGYFAELTANIRARPISWDAHQRAGSISVDNVRLIKSIDKQRREKRNELVEQVRAEDQPKGQSELTLLERVKICYACTCIASRKYTS